MLGVSVHLPPTVTVSAACCRQDFGIAPTLCTVAQALEVFASVNFCEEYVTLTSWE